MAPMGSVPFWVFTNAGMVLAAGVYIWWRLVLGTTRPGSTARVVGSILAAVLALLGPIALLSQYALPIQAQRIVGKPGWLGYALLVFVATATLLTEPLRIWWWGRRRRVVARGGSPSPERRLTRQRWLAAGIVVVAVVTTGIAALSALGGPAVRTRTIAVAGLPPQASGMRVALVSDLHLGSVLGHDFARSVVDLVNRQDPDLILLAGDLTDGEVAELAGDIAPLADLRAPDGVFAVMGNHEFYFDPNGWLAHLPTLGITVLDNEATDVRGIRLAGISDPAGLASGRGPDLDAALAGRAPEQPVLLLSHSPGLVGQAADRSVDLMVTGHTHGGQFYPFALAVAAGNPALSGWHRFGPAQLFITNGAGFWGPMARLGAAPDITVLTLVAPGSSEPTDS